MSAARDLTLSIGNLFKWIKAIMRSEPGSSGSIVSDYGLDDRAMEVRSLAEAKGFFL
jgi:hypothetical protein